MSTSWRKITTLWLFFRGMGIYFSGQPFKKQLLLNRKSWMLQKQGCRSRVDVVFIKSMSPNSLGVMFRRERMHKYRHPNFMSIQIFLCAWHLHIVLEKKLYASGAPV